MEIKFKGSNLSLPSTVIKVGDTLFFVGVNSQLKDIDLNSITGNKIISSVPSLDTVTCQLQTRYLNKFIKQHDNFTLVTVSRDLPFAQERICGSLLSAHSKV
jgi:thiol peroxidase